MNRPLSEQRGTEVTRVNVPVSAVPEDVRIVRNGPTQGVLHDSTDERPRALFVPSSGRLQVALGAVLDLLVERLDLVVVHPEDDVAARCALGVEQERLGRAGDEDHL